MKVIIIEKLNISGLKYDTLEKELLKLNFKKYNVKQIFNWLHNKMEDNFDNFSNISKENRNIIKAQKIKDMENEYNYFILLDDDHKILKEAQKLLDGNINVFHISSALV